MASKNFLPNFSTSETQSKRGNTLICLRRNKSVLATPEERVRQRILNWIMNDLGWPERQIELEKSYVWLSDPLRHRIRSDIELLDDSGKTKVVVECKASGIPLSPSVAEQAIEYAHKSGARHIWLTNGDSHKFLTYKPKRRKNPWQYTETLGMLDVSFEHNAESYDFPDIRNRQSVNLYFNRYFSDQGYSELSKSYQDFVLATHKLLFDSDNKKLPFSYRGVHILEDRGRDYHIFRNASGGYWENLYADFIVATSGRVEALSVAIYGTNPNVLYLCVGVRKPDRTHHALQMDLKYSEWDKENACWHIYHDGRMSSVKTSIVFDSLREAGVGDWIESYEDKEYIYLGELHVSSNETWRKSKNS